MDDELNREVSIPCICPDHQHGEDGDKVTLRERLDFVAVRSVRTEASIVQDEDPEASVATLLAVMNEAYIIHGVESWTVKEGRTKVEPTKGNIRKYLLADPVAPQIVGDYADAIYRPQVFLPLAELAKRSSQRSPTRESISQPTELPSTSPTTTETSSDESLTPSETRPKRSKRSSITSIPTGSTERTLNGSAGAYTS